VPKWVKASPFLAMLLGLGLAWQMYIRQPQLPGQLARNQRHLYAFLLNKWYFDEIYDAIIVRPARGAAGVLWKRGDGSIIDGAINGLALGVVPFFSRLAGRAQSGYLFHYAFAMVLGIVVIVTWLMIRGG
jgi:NADH-quinone oxidoreductase subunit L